MSLASKIRAALAQGARQCTVAVALGANPRYVAAVAHRARRPKTVRGPGRPNQRLLSAAHVEAISLIVSSPSREALLAVSTGTTVRDAAELFGITEKAVRSAIQRLKGPQVSRVLLSDDERQAAMYLRPSPTKDAVLLVAEGVTVREAATRWGVTEKAVRSAIQRLKEG